MRDGDDHHHFLLSAGRQCQNDRTGTIFKTFLAPCTKFGMPEITVANNQTGLGTWKAGFVTRLHD